MCQQGMPDPVADPDAHHQKSMVTQLLALLDGLEERGQVFVLATTNRPQDIDPAERHRAGQLAERPGATARKLLPTHILNDNRTVVKPDSAKSGGGRP